MRPVAIRHITTIYISDAKIQFHLPTYKKGKKAFTPPSSE
ncbi:hypothetical protein HMPREF1981_01292 [Bacteroides pyogenes F0041]|uniref:Uncharacterized protein n=1 Tax=Bacteroides pyogenes F0041 TaxID=1321819 RepID=U2CMT5_9BACE|nr:hypothetical protein HMPREF1981_01292 [Bacteroides pyogenes F0041]